MALCNDIIPVENGNRGERFKGDPTEIAMAEFVEKESSFSSLRAHFELLEEYAFDPQTRFMWSLHRTGSESRY